MRAATSSPSSAAGALALSIARRWSGSTCATASSIPSTPSRLNLRALQTRAARCSSGGPAAGWTSATRRARRPAADSFSCQACCLAHGRSGAAKEFGKLVPPLDSLLLAPIMVRVAFEAAGLGGLCTRVMALLAGLNPRQKHVGGLLTGGNTCMAARAVHHAVLFVIEGCVRHPAHRDVRPCHLRQRGVGRKIECVALLAGLSPQQLFGFGDAFGYPLRRGQQPH